MPAPLPSLLLSRRDLDFLLHEWLDVSALTAREEFAEHDRSVFDAVLGYPASQRQEELGAANVLSARTLIGTTTVLAQLLRTENTVAHDLAGTALNAVSYHARLDPTGARIAVSSTNGTMRARLGKVQVVGTDFVTLSGGTGTLAVTLVNGLDQPITVGVHPRTTGGDVTIAQVDPLRMAPGQRAVLRCLHGHLGVRHDHAVVLPGFARVPIAETRVQADARAMGRVGPLDLEVLGRGHHRDPVDDSRA